MPSLPRRKIPERLKATRSRHWERYIAAEKKVFGGGPKSLKIIKRLISETIRLKKEQRLTRTEIRRLAGILIAQAALLADHMFAAQRESRRKAKWAKYFGDWINYIEQRTPKESKTQIRRMTLPQPKKKN